jgi:hypothetical protein
MVFEKINPVVFLIAFCFGLFIVYISAPQPTVVIKYPTPDNSDIIFKDDADNCYSFNIEETTCPSDKGSIEKIPVQRKIEDFRGCMSRQVK